jgi:hypothetical protein
MVVNGFPLIPSDYFPRPNQRSERFAISYGTAVFPQEGLRCQQTTRAQLQNLQWAEQVAGLAVKRM